MQVSATTPTGNVPGASTSFDVRNADGSLPTSDIGSLPSAPAVTAATTTTTSPVTTTVAG